MSCRKRSCCSSRAARSSASRSTAATDWAPLSDDAVKGRNLFASNGCYVCHSGYSRPQDVRYALYFLYPKVSQPGDFFGSDQTPNLLGTERTGPDLSQESGWHPGDWQRLALVGGSAYSIVRRRRVAPNAWIASGALVVALATGLSRTGDYSLVYVGQLLGISLMFCGFTFIGRKVESRAARRPDVPLEPAAAAR